jgi:hypothetical protein
MVLFVWAKLGDILIGCFFYRLVNWVWECGGKRVCLLEEYFIKNLSRFQQYKKYDNQKVRQE